LESFTEDQIVDLVLLAGVREFANTGKSITDSTLHWAKFVWSVAGDVDLNITRSWYKMGQYVWSDRLDMDRVFHLAGILQTDRFPDINDVFGLTVGRASAVYKEIQTAAKSRFDMFWKRTYDLRKELYQKEAPRKFSDLYLAELDFEGALDGITRTDEYYKHPRANPEEFSRKVSRLHISLTKSDIGENCADAVIEFTSLLELMVIKLDADGGADESWNKAWLSKFSEMVDIYKNQVWTFPASQITVETITGPGSSSVIRVMNDKMEQASAFVDSFSDSMRLSLRREYLIPKLDEIDARIAERRKKGESEIDDLHQAIALYLRPR
jgi:hypothetical protein